MAENPIRILVAPAAQADRVAPQQPTLPSKTASNGPTSLPPPLNGAFPPSRPCPQAQVEPRDAVSLLKPFQAFAVRS
jgi:hypothetical protein